MSRREYRDRRASSRADPNGRRRPVRHGRRPRPRAAQVQAALRRLHVGLPETEQFLRRQEENRLVEPIDLSFEFDNGESLRLDSLYTISLDAVHALPDDVALALFRSGDLQPHLCDHRIGPAYPDAGAATQRAAERSPPMTRRRVEIDRAALDGHDAFRRLVVEPCRPVVIRGAASDWPLTGPRRSISMPLPPISRVRCGSTGRGVRRRSGDQWPLRLQRRHVGFNFRRQAMPLAERWRRIARGATARRFMSDPCRSATLPARTGREQSPALRTAGHFSPLI